MCRAKGPGGGRRCPGCIGQEALGKHNVRRRENRAIRRNVALWAEREGYGDDEVRRLLDAPPMVAKQWAKERGVDPKDFIEWVPARSIPDDPLGAGPVPAAPAPVPVRAPVPVPPPVGGGGRHRADGGGAAGRGRAGAPIAQPEPSPAVAPVGGRPVWAGTWCSPAVEDSILAAQAQQGAHRDERSLLAGSSEKQKRVVGGTNSTSCVTLDNGMRGYFKPFEGGHKGLEKAFGHSDRIQMMHEYGAWRLASQMGPPWSDLVPPTVVREFDGQIGSFQMERAGRGKVFQPWDAQEWRDAGFFDSLIGQQDRHPGNYLVAGDRISLIDHGYSFATPGSRENYSMLSNRRASEDPVLTHSERDVLTKVVNSPDLMGLSQVLEPARAAALKDRAQRMLAGNRVLAGGDY